MVPLQFSRELPKVEIPNGVKVLKMITRIINICPYPQQSQDLVSVPMANRGTMLIQPNPVKGEQWTTIVSKIKKRLEKNLGCHVTSLGPREYDTSTGLLINPEEEQIVLVLRLKNYYPFGNQFELHRIYYLNNLLRLGVYRNFAPFTPRLTSN